MDGAMFSHHCLDVHVIVGVCAYVPLGEGHTHQGQVDDEAGAEGRTVPERKENGEERVP